jgi:hypothetical protein
MAVIDFNVDPYYDDFEGTGGAKSKNFHRVLFRPGFPVQARELTQLQSILQNQIERHGRHVFKEGSMVIPGDIAFDFEYDFIKLQSTFNAQNVESYRADFVNKIITGSETGVKAKVIGTLAATSTTPLTLYIKYEDSGTDGATKRYAIGENVTTLNADNTVAKNPDMTADQTTELTASLLTTGTVMSTQPEGTPDIDFFDPAVMTAAGNSDTVGRGSAIQIQAGVYFINGFFVQNEAQRILLEPYHNYPSFRVGFQVSQTTVTPEEDATLKDNAQGASNFAAPGAHRYKITLTLTKKAITATDDVNFVELARCENGQISKLIEKASYNFLQEEFARRTYDESGDYEVKPFRLDIREHLDTGSNRGVWPTSENGSLDKLALGIEPGKAYVQGYELESRITKFLNVPKPRTFNSVVDTPIQTNVGNFVLVDTLKGVADINDFAEVFIYDDFTSNGSATAIGSANLRGLQLHDGDFTGNIDEVRYKLGIFDVQMNDGKDFSRDARAFGSSSTPGASTFSCNIVPKLVALNGTATVGTGDPTVSGVGTAFNSQLRAGDFLYLTTTTGDVRVGEVASVTNNLELELTGNGLVAVTGGTVKRMSAEILRPDQKILVYPTGYFRMRKIRGSDAQNPDNVLSSTYTVRRHFDTPYNIAAGAAQFTVPDNESFAAVSNLQNYVAVLTATGTGTALASADVGAILPITAGDLSVSSDGRTLTISNLLSKTLPSGANPTNGNSVEIIASIVISGSAGVEKTKALQPDSTIQITTQAAAQNTEITLGKADGYALKSVKMAADFSTNATSSDQDITDRFTFDNGQRDAFYDLARIVLKPGRPAPTGRLLVTFDYFTHSGGDYFSVDSYDGVVNYEDIPTYTSPDGDGDTYDLRDCLDFRPRIQDTGGSFTGSGGSVSEIPMIGTNFEADFSYFLGRIDKIAMNFDGKFVRIPGVPDTNPRPPLDLGKAMTLFEVAYKPYVINTSEVVARKIKNKRYTMKDIGRLETRISNLEEVSSLNLLEKATTDLLVLDADGNPRLKNGFIVDNFKGHGIGNVGSPDYRVAIDMKRKQARPMAHTEIVKMVEQNSTDLQRTAANYRKHKDGIVTLDYSELPFISNPYASDSMEVNAYKVSPFTGEMVLTPASDDWKDTTRRPDLVVVDDNNFDAIQFLADEIGVEGTVWESWQDNWFGEQVFTGEVRIGSGVSGGWNGNILQQVGTQQVGQVREGVETKLMNSTVDKAMGDRIVDMSMIPYMREIPVHVYISNMKPRSKVNAFFDNVNVNAYVKPDDKFTVTAPNRTDFQFDPLQDPGVEFDTDDARYFGTFVDPDSDIAYPALAFSLGDVVRNQVHTPTTVTNVVQVGNVVTVTVASTNGISIGHVVSFDSIVGSTELNEGKYRVESVTAPGTITIVQNDATGSPIGSITAYTSGGTVTRLQASGVVSYAGHLNTETSDNLPHTFHVSNIKNGFAIDDQLTGTIDNALGAKNLCTITAINNVSDNTSTDVYKNLKQFGDDNITDNEGTYTGVFVIPNTDTVKFRTGDRTLRFIDNNTNNIEIGVHTTKAEKIFHATGINETREETILSLRQAEFVRDRINEEREITRNITGSTRFQRTSRVQPPPSSDGGDGGDGGGSGAGGGCGQHDPLAQTFVVNEAKDGVMITKVDLYFNEAGTRPILIQMVNTKDGFPSEKIIQQTTIDVADVKVSTDASVPTTVVFDSPIFLAQDTTYALLIKVDQPGCKVFFSEIGQSNLGDNRTISKNPLTGTMFLSQNGNTWTPHQTRDIKMTMYRASFTGSVAVMDFKNVRNGFGVLNNNPFETAPNTNKVRVTQRNHGLAVGDKVTIANVAPGFYGANSTTNGIPHTEFNKQHTVVGPVTSDTYVIEVTAGNVVNGIAGLSSDTVGGANVQATRNFIADLIQPTLTNIRFAQSSLTYDMNVQNKAGGTFTGYQPVQENINQIYDEPKIIKSKENENTTVGYSAQIKATFNTLNDFVSPMIDSQRVSLCCISNRIDSRVETDVNLSTHDDRTAVSANTNVAFNTSGVITTTDSATRALFDTLDIGKYITVSGAANAGNNQKYLISNYRNDGTTATITTTPVPGVTESASNAVTIVQHEKFLHDIAPTGASNLANYVTRRFTLENPSTAIKILYEANRPASCTIDVYYKRITDGSEQKFETIPWVYLATEVSDSADGEATTFRERTHLVDGLAEFSAVAIKIVMKSTNTSFVPKIKNLRVIALAL